MTDLTRPVRRKVQTTRGEPLVVAMTPEGIWLRAPRRRIAYLMPYGLAHQIAAEMYGRAEKKRQKAERKAGRAVS